MYRIGRAVTRADVDATRMLFQEYANALNEQGFAAALELQAFETELATLPGSYAPPAGCLLLASTHEPAGCIALRPLDAPAVCEMKRLYVRPSHRSSGVGRALVEHLLAEARAASYKWMRLDTLPSMQSAHRLYRALGFYEIDPYGRDPLPEALFFERRVDDSSERQVPVSLPANEGIEADARLSNLEL